MIIILISKNLIVQQQKGIVATLLVYDDGTDAIAEGQLDDKLSVIANFQALQTIADQTRMLVIFNNLKSLFYFDLIL